MFFHRSEQGKTHHHFVESHKKGAPYQEKKWSLYTRPFPILIGEEILTVKFFN